MAGHSVSYSPQPSLSLIVESFGVMWSHAPLMPQTTVTLTYFDALLFLLKPLNCTYKSKDIKL